MEDKARWGRRKTPLKGVNVEVFRDKMSLCLKLALKKNRKKSKISTIVISTG